MTPEFTLLLLVGTVIGLGYGVIYPKFAGNDFKKVCLQDLFATSICLAVAGSLFYGSSMVFNCLVFKTNWFWFTFLSYVIIEVPVLLWYAKKHGMQFPK